MNEKGFAVPAIFGLAYILAAIIVLVLLAFLWLFWKPVFIFGVAIAIIYFGFTAVPQLAPKKQALKYAFGTVAVGFVLMLVALYVPLPTSILQPGNEAPMSGEIQLGIVGKELTEGTPVKILPTETLSADWQGQWWNRSFAYAGNSAANAAWYLDGEFIGLVEGQTDSINTEYVTGTNPEVGPISKEQWNWTSLPYVGKLGPQGTIVGVSGQGEFDVSGLESGTHTLTVKAGLINNPSDKEDIFADGGECFPLQTAPQGFPCRGVYGSTVIQNRLSHSNCASTSAYESLGYGVLYVCPGDNPEDVSCRATCCGQHLSSYPGHTYWLDRWLYASCDYGPFVVWDDWESIQAEQVTEEQAIANMVAAYENVAVAEFEVVQECQTECCVQQPGFTEKYCVAGEVCSSGTCITPIEPCPYECCEQMPAYQDKGCAAEEFCVSNYCIAQPPPPPEPFWTQVINAILDWLQSIFQLFFTITGETQLTPGETYVYDIALLTDAPDTDYSDGTAQFQYANWALVNQAGNIVQEGEWQAVEGSYQIQATVTIPEGYQNYAIIAVIEQYEMQFNFSTGEWETASQATIAKEGLDLKTGLPAPEPPTPPLTLFFEILQGFWSWILTFLGLG